METGNEWSDEEIDIYDNLSDEDCTNRKHPKKLSKRQTHSRTRAVVKAFKGILRRKSQKSSFLARSRLYQESLTDVVNEGNIVLYSEVNRPFQNRYFDLFNASSSNQNRRVQPQGIPLLKHAINQFRRSDMQMSLMNVAQAAYSARWNRPVAASRVRITPIADINDLHQPAVAVNGVCQKPTRRRKRVIQSGPSPLSSGNLSQERIHG
uniref:Uncharacterized protein n=1 Tax=Ditylenchus dipsaci TaxID=166011 RepID=A0A915E9Z4_9BILA